MVIRHLLLLSSAILTCWAVGAFAAARGAVVGAVGGAANHHRRHYDRRQLQSSSTSTMLSVNDLCGNDGIGAIESFSTTAFLTFFGNISIDIATESGGFNCGCMYDDDYNGEVSLMNSLRVVCSLLYTSPASGGENNNATNATSTPSIVSTNREFVNLASTVILLPKDEDEDPEQDDNNNTTTVERYIPTRSGWADATGLVSWSETFDFDYAAAVDDASILQFQSCDVDNGYCNEGESECFVCEGEDENSTQTTTVSISSACPEFETSCEAGYRGGYINEYFFDNNIVAILADERFECGDDVDDTVPMRDEFCANLADIETTLYDAFTVYANNTPPNEDFSCTCSNNNEDEDDPTVGLGFTVTCDTTWTTTDPDDAQEEIELAYTEIMNFVLRGAYLVPERMSWCNTPLNTQASTCTDYQFCVGQESLCTCSRVGCDTDYCELCSDGASVGYKCPSDPDPVLCSANVVGAFSFAFRDLQIAPNCTAAPVPSISPTVTGLPTNAPLVNVSSETLAPTTNGSSLVSNAPTPTVSSVNASDTPSASPSVPTDETTDETTVAPVAAPVGPTESSSSSPTLTPDGAAVIPPTSGVSAARNGMLFTAFMYMGGVTMAMFL